MATSSSFAQSAAVCRDQSTFRYHSQSTHRVALQSDLSRSHSIATLPRLDWDRRARRGPLEFARALGNWSEGDGPSYQRLAAADSRRDPARRRRARRETARRARSREGCSPSPARRSSRRTRCCGRRSGSRADREAGRACARGAGAGEAPAGRRRRLRAGQPPLPGPHRGLGRDDRIPGRPPDRRRLSRQGPRRARPARARGPDADARLPANGTAGAAPGDRRLPLRARASDDRGARSWSPAARSRPSRSPAPPSCAAATRSWSRTRPT